MSTPSRTGDRLAADATGAAVTADPTSPTPGLSLINRPPAPRPGNDPETAPAASSASSAPASDVLHLDGPAQQAVDPGEHQDARPAHVPDPQLLAFARMDADDPGHAALRQTVIEANLPLVHHLAKRFVGRGEPYDDLVQVGTIGLLHAVDRYDPERGSFAGYAVPTIVGEIRRHFRDRGWALRIPRRVQDLGRQVSEARETLTHQLDRSPTIAEIAANLGVDADLVLEALETASAYLTVPLPATADETDRLQRACLDSDLEQVEQREMLRPLLARLPAREQHILQLRFVKGMSQSQIAREVGVSQMHVSRLLAKSLGALRAALTERQ